MLYPAPPVGTGMFARVVSHVFATGSYLPGRASFEKVLIKARDDVDFVVTAVIRRAREIPRTGLLAPVAHVPVADVIDLGYVLAGRMNYRYHRIHTPSWLSARKRMEHRKMHLECLEAVSMNWCPDRIC